MCGITGTLFTKNINTSSRVDPYSTLAKLVDSDEAVKAHEIDELHKFSLMYYPMMEKITVIYLVQ